MPASTTTARFIPALALLCASLPGPQAQAAVVMSLQQVGADVELIAYGSVNISGTQRVSLPSSYPGIIASGQAVLGAVNSTANVDAFFLPSGSWVSGPFEFGTLMQGVSASSSTGDVIQLNMAFRSWLLPAGYQSGAFLRGTATWNNFSLNSLGVTTGIYTWTWGSGADADSATLYAGVPVPATVPEPGTLAVAALGLAIGAGARHRHRRRAIRCGQPAKS